MGLLNDMVYSIDAKADKHAAQGIRQACLHYPRRKSARNHRDASALIGREILNEWVTTLDGPKLTFLLK